MSTATPDRQVIADLADALRVTELVPLAQGGLKYVLRCLYRERPAVVQAVLTGPGPECALALERARREHDILAAVNSPRVVRVLGDVVELRYGGTLPYGAAWVEELLDGVDLDHELRAPWPVERVARLVVQLAEALAACHAAGVVHRDLTPGNVRLRANGDATLMDAGLARRLADPDGERPGSFGTPGYWSPEHLVAGGVGPPGDIFGVGVLAYQALTGRLPVDPTDLRAYPYRLVECVVAPTRSVRPDVPVALAEVVDRCLRRRPGDRYADGAALLAELRRAGGVFAPWCSGGTVAPVPPPEPVSALVGPDALGYDGDPAGPVTVRGAFGVRRLDVESIAADQEPFAVRLRPYRHRPAPGVEFAVRTVELDGGRFTNSYELTVDTAAAAVELHSDPTGFHLPDVVGGGTVAAVGGSFSFISDDPGYRPVEPCLDFWCRGGRIVSLPTATKPALLVGPDGPVLRDLDARGTVRIGSRAYDWIGSKVPAGPDDTDRLVVYGAANCQVEYVPAPRVGSLRRVERDTNRTPVDPDAVDLVVGDPTSGSVVVAVRPGGGSDLFEGRYVLRGGRGLTRTVRVGDPVTVSRVDGLDAAGLSSGGSVGPSVVAAAVAPDGRLPGYDGSLGVSPFLPGHRYARTLVSVTAGTVRLWVLDGAPRSRTFQGVSCAETVRLLADDGVDPGTVHHLDGGQSSKVAVGDDGRVTVLGSMHYLLWPKFGTGGFRWHGRSGRVLHSALRVRRPG